jgi:hypothetical protein
MSSDALFGLSILMSFLAFAMLGEYAHAGPHLDPCCRR